jgi:hypothetical protein
MFDAAVLLVVAMACIFAFAWAVSRLIAWWKGE